MKLDQLCFYAEYDDQMDAIKTIFGLQDAPWITDTVTMMSRFPKFNPNDLLECKAELNFCESLGIQFEIMRQISGPHWNAYRSKQSYFIGHVGLHLADDEEWPPMLGAELIQESKTTNHTAPAFNDPTNAQYGRRYHYRIYTMPRSESVYVKLIKRIHRAHD